MASQPIETDELDRRQFVALAYALDVPDTGELLLANTGLPDPYLLGRNGIPEPLEPSVYSLG